MRKIVSVLFFSLLFLLFVLFFVYPYIRSFLVMTGHIQYKPTELLSRKGFDWRTAETEHFFIHYEAGSYAEKKLDRLKQINESAFENNLHLLGEDTYHEKLNIFAVESREKMKKLIHRKTNGMGIPKYHTACYVASKTIWAATAHELFHVMHHHLWGKPKYRYWQWLSEGFAVYADDRWFGYHLHTLSRYFFDKNRLLPLIKLMRHWRSVPIMISYPEAGSFVRFLFEEYGWVKLKALWEQGPNHIKQIYGKDLQHLEEEWHTFFFKFDTSHVKYSFDN